MSFTLTDRPFNIGAMMLLEGSAPGTGWSYDKYSGSSLSLTYSFSIGSSAQFDSIYADGLAQVASFTNIAFTRRPDEAVLAPGTYQGDFNADASADLRLSQQSDGSRTGGLAETYIWTNDADADMEDIDSVNHIWTVNHYTILHELGHALTLLHPSANQNPQNGAVLLPAEQNNNYTVMHYYLEGTENTATDPLQGEWDYRHFQLYDVYALQLRFGVNAATYAGTSNHTAASLGMNEWLRVLWDASGADTIDMTLETRAQQIDLGAGKFSNIGDVAGNNPTGHNLAIAIGATIEHARGGSGNDGIVGNEAGNILRGNAGIDTISGLDGNDVILGGAGNDTISGGNGNDSIRVSGLVAATGYDAINAGSGTDNVLALSADTEFGLRSFSGVESFSANGFANVWIRGSGGNNVFNFTAVALDGVWIDGGAGNDTITLFSFDGEVLGGTGDDVIRAGAADALVDGGAGNDMLYGDDGNDVLSGADGLDELSGGAGSDQFRFYFATGGVDAVTDFTSGLDEIALSSVNFAHTATIAFVQNSAPVANSANSTFLYNRVTGALSYDADGNGAGAAVHLATLDPSLTLAVTDFGFF
jgi:Ca2+-binding RTX toxin-like protein